MKMSLEKNNIIQQVPGKFIKPLPVAQNILNQPPSFSITNSNKQYKLATLLCYFS